LGYEIKNGFAVKKRGTKKTKASSRPARISKPINYKADESKPTNTALLVCIGITEKRPAKGELMELILCSRCESGFVNGGYIVL